MSQLRECATEPHAGHFRLNLAGATAVVFGDVDFWIERLDLGWSSLQKQEDDRLAFVQILLGRSLRFGRQQSRQRQATQAANAKKVAAVVSGPTLSKTGIGNGQHRLASLLERCQ